MADKADPASSVRALIEKYRVREDSSNNRLKAFIKELEAALSSSEAKMEPEIRCERCGEDIRFIDGEWLDRETHSTCNVLDAEGLPRDDAPKHLPLAQGEELGIVASVTAIVREADAVFTKVGGGSRHWVRDSFLPLLNSRGFKIVEVASSEAPRPQQEQESK